MRYGQRIRTRSGQEGGETSMIERFEKAPLRGYVLIGAGLIALQILGLALEGHPAICKCGTIKLWEGEVNSAGNSQHLTDWYSFTHVIHGILLYALLFLASTRWKMPFGLRLALAIGIEAGWEVFENTAFVIARYRAATISLDYYGDSILNSANDTLTMIVGFILASRLPVPATVLLGLALEIFVGWAIRDNLTLNIIMLIHPFEAIKAWQGAA
jgi:hypothetical protein